MNTDGLGLEFGPDILSTPAHITACSALKTAVLFSVLQHPTLVKRKTFQKRFMRLENTLEGILDHSYIPHFSRFLIS